MPKKQRNRTAAFVDAPIFIDEPILVRLKLKDNVYVIGFAIPRSLRGDMSNPFFGAEVSERQWLSYLEENNDLRFLFRFPDYERWFVFDFDLLKNNTLKLTPISIADTTEDWFPGIGLFARDHTEPVEPHKRASGEQTFLLDGNWDLDDLGQLRKKLGDVYAFQLALADLNRSDVSFKQKRKIVNSFSHYPLKGGSSYMHLYKDLNEVQSPSDRLDMNGIQVSSPGYVSIGGRKATFERLKRTIETFGKNIYDIRSVNRELYTYLQKSDLLSSSASDFDKNDPRASEIERLAFKLAKLTDCPEPDRIFTMTGRNPLAFAKIVLSFVRRCNDMFLFFAQGRITFQD